MENNKISRLISELFKEINSKEDLNYFSNILANSLDKFNKKFRIEPYTEISASALNIISNDEFKKTKYIVSSAEDEYLAILNDLHAILLNCAEFSNSQKLDFCTNQRYFMKKYLKELLIKLNRIDST
ncbi:MAG: hypothetical protein ACFE9S_11810 [Candidatus Hermodarchaeota archaeon]